MLFRYIYDSKTHGKKKGFPKMSPFKQSVTDIDLKKDNKYIYFKLL